jgi:hypothetical protein
MSGADVARPQSLTLRGNTDRFSPVPDALLAFALAMLVFYPVFAAQLHASMTPSVVVVLLIWINAVLDRCTPAYHRDVIVLVVAYALFIVILSRLFARLDGNAPAVTLERVVLLLPLTAAAGWMLVRTGRIVQYLSWLLAVGALTVVPAVFEYLTNRRALPAILEFLSLKPTQFSAVGLVRNGHTRAIVGADHPLVLGALFLAMIPIAMYLGGRYRYLLVVGLYVGIFTTGSNGPELVGAAVVAICVIPPVARTVLSSWRPFTLLFVAIAAYLAAGSIWLWSTQIPGSTTTDVSDQYRAALYYLLPRFLHARPFGYGIGGLPPNTWYVSAQTSGLRDVAASIDSELVYSATQFGIFAVVGFVVIAVIGVRAAVRNQAIGLSSLSTTMVGLFLAIHSWNSLGTFWFLEFGACAALVVHYDGALDWVGLSRLRPAPAPAAADHGVLTPANDESSRRIGPG